MTCPACRDRQKRIEELRRELEILESLVTECESVTKTSGGAR